MRKGGVVVILLSCLVLFYIILASIPYRTGVYVTHVVQPGETLWGIVEPYCPEGVTMDEYMALVRETGQRVKLHPGDRVVIPIVAKRPLWE